MMATTPAADEDEVEFVSEGPLRPVLEYIDLLSDGEDEDLPVHGTVEDQVDKQKARVESTLDRLAHQVAAEKQERAEKCRAFKEKVVSQQAHGRQELAFNSGSGESGESREARHCVNMWLKMPGVKPGAVHTGFRRRTAAPSPGGNRARSSHTCPVANCGRVFDGALLLEGHLKRYDHSPCDPTVLLRGSPAELFTCVACAKPFHSRDAWQDHLRSKLSSPNPEGHVSGLSFQVIVCFACPTCCLLFSLLDQCLQHMAARKHFIQAVCLTETKPPAGVPIPVPRYAKNRLIALCKEVPFSVHCTSCRSPLSSHMEARAHFSVRCRKGGAAAKAAQSVPEVMRQLCAYGRCAPCGRTFLGKEEAEAHARETQHETEAFRTVTQALLHYCHHQDSLRARRGSPSAKRPSRCQEASPAKRRRGQAGGGATTWACECGLSFPEEAAAHRHLLAANRVFHKCGVCGKEMAEASIARLHMSRFHGGAHLSNFLFHCARCRVDMPREEDILSHVRDAHAGHTFYREREAAEEAPASTSKPARPASKPATPTSKPATPRTATPTSKPATPSSKLPAPAASPSPAPEPAPALPSGSRGRRGRRWLCRMCEDVFDSEQAVRAHCGDVDAHSFQKFLCGGCERRFFKEATLVRHWRSEHGGGVQLRRFCGLCDGMAMDTEDEFLGHYRSLHAVDYCRLEGEEPAETTPPDQAPGQSAEPPCPCMGTEKGKAEQREAFTCCMRRLASLGQCCYFCPPCGLRTRYYIQVKEHVQRRHGAPGKAFLVTCGSCPESYPDVPTFHSHYHAQHCPMEPCLGLRGGAASEDAPKVALEDTPKVASKVATKVLKAEEVSLETNAEEVNEVTLALALSSEEAQREAENSAEEADEDLKKALALSTLEAEKQAELDREMEEALQRSLLEF